jgi:hydrogenase expression/formation protein HypD
VRHPPERPRGREGVIEESGKVVAPRHYTAGRIGAPCQSDRGVRLHLVGFGRITGPYTDRLGYDEYEPLAERFRVPIVVTGFEPLDLLEGVYRCVRRLEEGRSGVENQYARAVRREGNPSARRLLAEVFEVTDRNWRGIGTIPQSGYRFAPAYAEFDAETRFAVEHVQANESSECISGLILQGLKKPNECPAFGKSCTPEAPLGATMVSSEGACAAYYNYGKYRQVIPVGPPQVRNRADV